MHHPCNPQRVKAASGGRATSTVRQGRPVRCLAARGPGEQVVSAATIVEKDPARLAHDMFVWGQPDDDCEAAQHDHDQLVVPAPAHGFASSRLAQQQQQQQGQLHRPLEHGQVAGARPDHATTGAAPQPLVATDRAAPAPVPLVELLPMKQLGGSATQQQQQQQQGAAEEQSPTVANGAAVSVQGTTAAPAPVTPPRRRRRGGESRSLESALQLLDRALCGLRSQQPHPQPHTSSASSPPAPLASAQQQQQQQQHQQQQGVVAAPAQLGIAAPPQDTVASQRSSSSLMRQVAQAASVQALAGLWTTQHQRMRVHHVAAMWKRLAQLAAHLDTASPRSGTSGSSSSSSAPQPHHQPAAAAQPSQMSAAGGRQGMCPTALRLWGELVERSCFFTPSTSLSQAALMLEAHTDLQQALEQHMSAPPASARVSTTARRLSASASNITPRTLPPNLSVVARAEFIRCMLAACEPQLEHLGPTLPLRPRLGVAPPTSTSASAAPASAPLQVYVSLMCSCVRLQCLPPSDSWMRGWWAHTQPLLRSAAPRQLVSLFWALGHLGSSHSPSSSSQPSWPMEGPGLHQLPPPPGAWMAEAYAASGAAMAVDEDGDGGGSNGGPSKRARRSQKARHEEGHLSVRELCMLVHGAAKLQAWSENNQQPPQQQQAWVQPPSMTNSASGRHSSTPAGAAPPFGIFLPPPSPSAAPSSSPSASAPVSSGPPNAWAAALWGACEQQLDVFDAPAYALLMHGVGMLGCRPPAGLLEDLWEGATSLLHDFTTQEVSLLLRGAAYLQGPSIPVADPGWQQLLWRVSLPRLRAPDTTAAELAHLGWAVLVALQMRPPAHWVGAWLTSLARLCHINPSQTVAEQQAGGPQAPHLLPPQRHRRREHRPPAPVPLSVAKRAVAALLAAGVIGPELRVWCTCLRVRVPRQLLMSAPAPPGSAGSQGGGSTEALAAAVAGAGQDSYEVEGDEVGPSVGQRQQQGGSAAEAMAPGRGGRVGGYDALYTEQQQEGSGSDATFVQVAEVAVRAA